MLKSCRLSDTAPTRFIAEQCKHTNKLLWCNTRIPYALLLTKLLSETDEEIASQDIPRNAMKEQTTNIIFALTQMRY